MEWLVPPAQVGRLDDHLVATSHSAGQAHADPHEERAGRDGLLDCRRVSPDPIGDRDAPRILRAQVVVVSAEYLAAQAHGACRHVVSVDLDRNHVWPVGARTDEVRRPADPLSASRHPLADQPQADEVGDDRRDRGTVEAEQLGEVRSSQFTVPVDVLQHDCPVGASRGFGSNDVGQAHWLTCGADSARRLPDARRPRLAPRQGVGGRRAQQHDAGDHQVVLRPEAGFQAQPVRDDRDDQTTDDRIPDVTFAAEQ